MFRHKLVSNCEEKRTNVDKYIFDPQEDMSAYKSFNHCR